MYNRFHYIGFFLMVIACQVPTQKKALKNELSDLEVKILRVDVNDSFISDQVFVYGEIELMANYDSIRIFLDTTNDEIKQKAYNASEDREIWKYYNSHFSNYADSVNEWVSVWKLNLINQNNSYGPENICYFGELKNEHRLLKKGVSNKYFFRTTYHRNVEFDSVSFEINYIRNGETIGKTIGKRR